MKNISFYPFEMIKNLGLCMGGVLETAAESDKTDSFLFLFRLFFILFFFLLLPIHYPARHDITIRNWALSQGTG